MATAQNPTPQFGSGTFGAVPGAISLPDPASDLRGALPNLPQLNAGASSVISSKLGGQLSPGTQRALQDAGATFGTRSGMPGSDLSWNSIYGNIAGASEAQQQQGIQDYNSFIPTVSGTQTVSPNLQVEVANQNAVNAAAPNPAAAANYAQSIYDQYLQRLQGPAGGTGGGRVSGGLPDGTYTHPNNGISNNSLPWDNNWGFGPNVVGSNPNGIITPADPASSFLPSGDPAYQGDWGNLDPFSSGSASDPYAYA